MPRSLRQSKILELISANEIEKQEELVALLRENNFDITQATVSRDIKELGLIKVLSENKIDILFMLINLVMVIIGIYLGVKIFWLI